MIINKTKEKGHKGHIATGNDLDTSITTKRFYILIKHLVIVGLDVIGCRSIIIWVKVYY